MNSESTAAIDTNDNNQRGITSINNNDGVIEISSDDSNSGTDNNNQANISSSRYDIPSIDISNSDCDDLSASLVNNNSSTNGGKIEMILLIYFKWYK